MREDVILVNENDEAIGVMEKMEAHRKGVLHRAFSVFIFNSKGQLLLQKRALSKYHSAGLWTNTCCSHPSPGEKTPDAAQRRLMEEMGMNVPLKETSSFIYKTAFDNGLTEHEFDHVYTGYSDEDPNINLSEVAEFQWKNMTELKKELEINPGNFTSWFKIAIEKLF